ncbi:MAG TPA: VOC family protein [Gammaproteobacteria bacterium]|nr:VOC family protein [Gammaproteobacteria bacterium]
MSTHHTIDYIEFTVRDLGVAKRFYAAAFGWQFNDYGPEYAGIKGGTGEVGGLHQTSDARTTGPLVILYSKDLDRTVAAVKSAGGKILREPYAFPGGRRFHFTDPSGNELGVWSEK